MFKAYSHKIIGRNGLKYDNTAPSHCSNWGLHNNNPPNQIPTDPKKQIEIPNNVLHDVTKFGVGFKQAYSHKIKGQHGLKHENTAPGHSSNWGLHNYNPPNQIPTNPKKQIESRNVLHDVTKFGIGFKQGFRQAYSHKIKGQNGLKHENTAPSNSSNWGLHNCNPPNQIPIVPTKKIEIHNNVLHGVTKFGIGLFKAYSHKIKGQNGLKHENTAPSHSSNWGLHNI